jgi:ParB-like chromosome segregation protein Spo0J
VNIQQIPVARIILDERNPRIAHVVADVTSATPQEWIPMALGQHAPEDQESGSASTYSSLKASIRAYRGLITPIIVTPRDDSLYVVIEGNTRVAIFRELADEGSPGNWETIPAIVRADLEEEGEHAIRLQAHLVGPRPWRPYAKAKYLHDLYINQKMSIGVVQRRVTLAAWLAPLGRMMAL